VRPDAGHEYLCGRLVQADDDASVVVRRTTWHGVPTLVLIHRQGHPDLTTVLVRSVATSLRTPVVLGLAEGPRRVQVAVGGSTVSLLPGTGRRLPLDPTDAASWHFTLADLEGVI
jgi:hypothetical protein